jgi:hypothetical protein
MYYPKQKELARKMRERGSSLGEISAHLNIPKSTLGFWFKDIILSGEAIDKIETKGNMKSVRALLKYVELKRQERIETHKKHRKEGADLLGELSSRDILMTGLGLYWGEGYKYKNGELGFTNSNPSMINFYFKWLKLWSVEKNSLIFRLTINEFFRKEENNIKDFWINFLDVK